MTGSFLEGECSVAGGSRCFHQAAVRLLAEKPLPDKITLASQMPSSLSSESLKFQ